MQEKTEKKLTGYPSIDKPWLKYYSEEAINAPLPQKTMFQAVFDNNRDYKNGTAFQYFGTRITYGQFFQNVKRTANALYKMGIRCGDTITIMSMNIPETISLIYASNYLGAISNLVYLTLSEKEIINTIQSTQSKALFLLDAAIKKIDSIKDQIDIPIILLPVSASMSLLYKIGFHLKKRTSTKGYLSFKEFIKIGINTIPAPVAADHASAAIIVYTSGTTGVPKGVVLSNDCMNAVAVQCSTAGKNYLRGETTFLYLPPFTGYGIAMLHLALYYGINLTLHLSVETESVLKGFIKSRPNRIAGGPAFIDALTNQNIGDLSNLIDFTGGGESLSIDKEKEINQYLQEHGSTARYTTGYGMTEFASAVTLQTNRAYKIGSIGIPLPKANIKIIDLDTKREIGYNNTGEMLFSAPNTMTCYYDNETATAKIVEVDENGQKWLHTGDLGYIDEDGFVFLKGRIKRIYLTKGADGTVYKLFPQRIEDFFEKQDTVDRCGVTVKKDERKMFAPVVFVTFKYTIVEETKEIIRLFDMLKQELPEHLWPSAIIPIDKMPMTPSGKIDYRVLGEMAKGS